MQPTIIDRSALFNQIILHRISAIGKGQPARNQILTDISPVYTTARDDPAIAIQIDLTTYRAIAILQVRDFRTHPSPTRPKRALLRLASLLAFGRINAKDPNALPCDIKRVAINHAHKSRHICTRRHRLNQNTQNKTNPEHVKRYAYLSWCNSIQILNLG